MYQTLEYLRKHNITNVIDFGKAFTLGNKEFDLLLNSGLFIELKNCDFVAQGLNAQKIDQLIQGYFKNISSLDDMKWVAAHRKLKSYSLWETIPQAETKMREMWKDVLSTRTQVLFDNMHPNLKINLEIESVSDITNQKIEEIVNEIIFVE